MTRSHRFDGNLNVPSHQTMPSLSILSWQQRNHMDAPGGRMCNRVVRRESHERYRQRLPVCHVPNAPSSVLHNPRPSPHPPT